ncbi:MAG: radical SAM protein [Candidatus Hermodarchaeia archaeon]|jgi:radical SAM protein with 4Fe4S-binding SPASM domain
MAECLHPDANIPDSFLNRLASQASQHRIPIYGSIELTKRCNLRCVHCYLGPQEVYHINRHEELTTAQFISILDQITDAGCLYLLITGGDPMLRKDFAEIYTHAKKCGLLVTVFTNGTLINDRILNLFTKLPPKIIEVSVYGATAEVYERVTGNKYSFQRCMDGIQALQDRGINFNLKTVLMKPNRHELPAMRKLAEELGVPFRFEAQISPTLDGDLTPIELRVPAFEAVREEFSDDVRSVQWVEFIKRIESTPPQEFLYQCGAGHTLFHIDPTGRLQPCLMTERVSYDLNNGDFETGWRDVISKIRELKAPPSFICNDCDKRYYCDTCPAFFELENGENNLQSEYVCSMGHLRFEEVAHIK